MTVIDITDVEPFDMPAFAHMWEPEDQFIGAVLHLKGPAARELVELVPTTAIEQPIARWAYELITTLVQAGGNPDPTLILAAARRQPPAWGAAAIDELTVTTLRPNIIGDLGNYLANTLTRVHNPAGAREYARALLDDAFRRATAAWGARLQQMATAYADREDLTTVITEGMRGELRDLWQRAERAGRPSAHTPKG
ncbi:MULTISPECIES: helicase DnaB [Mycobacterium]|uniref:DNA helicase DnaB-like N-terminal domain-containing protein n=2 Tax=Mycobacterium TaxID=1763 RepID=A0AA37VCR6_9MYCO|nr:MULTISPECIES: helicase DnaB [Mycobacterium]ATQ40896.2 helicase DnaB [Mycobacterium avium subsp. hominissuis]GLB86435.1 hypothetical protein SRL2020028_56910 [Mycobacterium kiyosense]